MMTESCIRLLESKGVRPTANRILLVKALSDSGKPMSMSDLEIYIGTMDRSSVFRCLSVFVKHHVVHLIDDGSDSSKFELCPVSGDCSLADMHAHFHCERCGATVCLDDVVVPVAELPTGYSAASVNYVVKGVCPECSAADDAGAG